MPVRLLGEPIQIDLRPARSLEPEDTPPLRRFLHAFLVEDLRRIQSEQQTITITVSTNPWDNTSLWVTNHANLTMTKRDLSYWVGRTLVSAEFFHQNLLNNIYILSSYLSRHRFSPSILDWTQALFTALTTEIWPFCNRCNNINCNISEEDEHPQCYICERYDTNLTNRPLGTDSCREPNPEIEQVCALCDNLYSCETYNERLLPTTVFFQQDQMTNRHATGTWYCPKCAENQEWLTTCPVCGNEEDVINIKPLTPDGACVSCWAENTRSSSRIETYSFTPRFEYYPERQKYPEPTTLYMGMEIETSFRGYEWEAVVRRWVNQPSLQNLFYLKSDSSINNGVEIVSHPFKPEWALKELDLTAFDLLVEYGNAYETHSSCGSHIHISKSAFTTSHLWKFLKAHTSLAKFLQTLGGRGDNRYAGFGDTFLSDLKAQLKSIAQSKESPFQRGVAVNLQPEHTIELRYPAGGSSSFLIRKNIQLVLAIFNFTKTVTTKNAQHQALDDPGYLLHWIQSRPEQFAELNKWINEILPQPKRLLTTEEMTN